MPPTLHTGLDLPFQTFNDRHYVPAAGTGWPTGTRARALCSREELGRDVIR